MANQEDQHMQPIQGQQEEPCNCPEQPEQPEQEIAECTDVIHDTVCVQAEVTITPNVEVGEIESFCIGGPVIGACPGIPSPTDSCTFTVSQSICIQIPLTFSANATAVPRGIVCGTPGVGPCGPATP